MRQDCYSRALEDEAFQVILQVWNVLSTLWSSAAIPVFFSWVPLKACGMTGNKMKAETTD